MSESVEQLAMEDSRPKEGPPKPSKVGGWAAEDGRGKRKRDTIEEDDRLKVPDTAVDNDNDDDLPVIPDLEAVQEEDLATQIAAPPVLTINRLTSYKQLESDLQKHTFAQLDGDIDLKLLNNAISPEDEITEDDSVWEWDKLFAEMSSDIATVWSRQNNSNFAPQQQITESATTLS